MPTRFLLHTILLILAATGVYLWLSLPSLSPYTLQLVAVLVLLYLGTHYLRGKYPQLFRRNTVTLDLTILTSLILLLVTETGALISPLFFLCYFLLFAVSMLYEIEATLVLTGTLILYFLFLPGSDLSDLAHLSELVALVMITPLAIFTGHQYEVNLEQKTLARHLSRHLQHEESDVLLFLSLNLKTTLLSALDKLAIAIPSAGSSLRTQLSTLYSDLKTLYRSADELQQTIDRETDQ